MLKYIIYFLLFLPVIAYATDYSKISKKKQEVLLLKNDTTKVKELIALAFENEKVPFDEAIDYIEKAINISRKLSYLKGIARAEMARGYRYYFSNEMCDAVDYFEKAKDIYQKINDVEGVSDANNNIGTAYERMSEYEVALDYYFKAKGTRDFLNLKGKAAQTIQNISAIYQSLGNFKEAREYQFLALEMREECGDVAEIANTYTNIGRFYGIQKELDSARVWVIKAAILDSILGRKISAAHNKFNLGKINDLQGSDSLALKMYIEAHKVYEEQNFDKGSFASSSSIAKLLMKQGSLQRAKEYFEKALKIAQNNQSTNNFASIYVDLADLYYKEDSTQTNVIVNLYKDAYQSYKVTGRSLKIAVVANKIGLIYLQINELDNAIPYLIEAVKIYEDSNTELVSAETYIALSKYYHKKREYKSAEKQVNKAISIVDKTKEINLEIEAVTELRAIYISTKKFEKASIAGNQLLQLIKRVYSDSVAKSVNEIEAKYRKAEQDKKIAEQEVTIKEEEQKSQQIKFFTIILGLSALFGWILVILFRRNQKRAEKYNIALQKKNQEILTLNKDIEHRISNQLKTMIALIESDIEKTTETVAENVLLEQQNRVQLISFIHGQLQRNDDKKSIDFSAFLPKLCSHLEDFYSKTITNLKINVSVPKAINIDAIEATSLGLIVNELVTNAVKYAFSQQSKPLVEVDVRIDNDQLRMAVKDNGEGIEFDKMREGGIGLSLVKKLVKRLKGKFETKNLNGLICQVWYQFKGKEYAAS